MRVGYHTFRIQKAGNAEEEYEDAFWPEQDIDRELPAFRAAVADGATESSFSGEWARLLVRAWCRGRLTERRLWRDLRQIQRKWLTEVASRPLPWYAEEKLRSGAFSTLLGLHVRDDSAGERGMAWVAVAIGDSCLFQVREDELVLAHPLSSSTQYTTTPLLLSSEGSANAPLRDARLFVSGRCRPGDTFYLMTDALAHWFHTGVEQGHRPWRALDGLQSWPDDRKLGWIRQLQDRNPSRSDRGVRNDDVTLVTVRVT